MSGLFDDVKGGGFFRFLVLLACGFWLCACASVNPSTHAQAPGARQASAPRGTMRPYEVNGRWYTPRLQPDYDERGLASWYGPAHDGKPTSTGEIFDQWAITGAHKTLPIPCVVEVTNLENGRRLKVRINDRGPFVDGRIVDLSRAAAQRLGFERQGVARVRVRYLGLA
ncbi:MAG: septal ring lytic transglycosylase RlpA family protein [Caulobacteraceae bacterium]|nr:septal ring lytic transglycosylase RlpA family protein [Caulobacteraceae bacterium]